ncbi:CHASE2 domain-containing protein [Bradyrhizobium sp. 21]|uniref:CHASE2 domain-containing protein n=1 Tax=Bradyrhizobium sp. 21 TaxID=2782666 RepID=UPI001FF7E440|nr:CHASE2 domain-containing protein [Bradyrhizobium sp. 21]
MAETYAASGFCESTAAVTPLPLTCEAVQGRAVLVGSSHRDSRDLHFTPLGPMPGAYVLANTIAGARDTLLNSGGFGLDSRFWGIALFVAFALLAARLRNIFAIAVGASLALVFLSVIANWLSIPASRSYESVNSAMVMLAVFLAFAAIVPDVEKWIAVVGSRLFQRPVGGSTNDGS